MAGSDPDQPQACKRYCDAVVPEAHGGFLSWKQRSVPTRCVCTSPPVVHSHACGGNARCTTCRVEFISGEPAQMTEAEKNVLTQRGLINTPHLRLSCQIVCDHDMDLKAISRLAGSGRPDAGKRPADQIQPQPAKWVMR